MRTASALVLALVLTAGCSSGSSGGSDRAVAADEAARLLIDRNWMDLWPTSKDQQLHVYRFTPAMGGGVFQDRTLFAGAFELFRFTVEGDRIVFDLPQTGDEVRASFRIERVDGPEPFDLRLTLDPSPRGPAVYYGRSVETGAEMLRF